MDNNVQNTNFLQSAEWRKFQESVGRKTFFVENANFSASLIEHALPIVGKYFYCPRGPIVRITNQESRIMNEIQKLITLAKKEGAGWIRIDPENEETIEIIKNSIDYKIHKAPHDMQP